ncbi:MAG: hypothetical protein JSV63_00430 [Candidatus Aenigmatarchaeota archaeon]|nr:MAG: hypothetical protein JSV63_00430 [Candidatus Aenigmarchaeota archaeon]
MDIDMIEVLKWAAVIFIIGFIGYFGRYLSELIIARLKRKKPGKQKTAPEKPAKQDMGYELEKKRLKLEKKRLKLEKKKAK